MATAACQPPGAARAVRPAEEPAQPPPTPAALGPVRPVDPEGCARPPKNGQVVAGAVQPEESNFYYVTNRTDSLAIVKVRTEKEARLVAAVYVAPGQSAAVGPLAPGAYRLSYAMGRFLAADCRSLDFPSGYGQTARPQSFVNRLQDGAWVGHTETQTLDENDVDGGEGDEALQADKFNAP